MDLVKHTAVGRYYKVYQDDGYISQHTTEREASEKSVNLCFNSPLSNIKYTHEYEVKVALTDAGLTIAGTTEQPVNMPPVIVSTPNPLFTEFVPGTYDMSQDFTDDGLSTVLTNLTNVLPNGLSYDSATHILTYDGIGLNSVSQHQLQVDDQVNPVVTSNSFNIDIRALTISTIPPLSISVGGTINMSQYIVDVGNVRTATAINGLTTFASYDPVTELLLGVLEGLETGLTLEVTF